MSYDIEWLSAPVIVVSVVVFLLVPPFAVIGVAVVLVALLMALVALAGAILATPYLLVRSLGRRLAERHESGHDSAQIARAGGAGERLGTTHVGPVKPAAS